MPFLASFYLVHIFFKLVGTIIATYKNVCDWIRTADL